jgi:excisionase family DNA binding protein
VEKKMETPKVLSVAQAAEALNLSDRYTRELIRGGDLQAIRAGRRVLVVAESIDNYIAKNTIQVGQRVK